MKGIVASMDQCIDQPRRRKIFKKEHIRFEEAGRTTMKQAVSRAVEEGREDRNEGTMDDQSKRKMKPLVMGGRSLPLRGLGRGNLRTRKCAERRWISMRLIERRDDS
jgi:hypothetical protein